MLTVLLSTATATLFGFADFLGGWASRRESAISVTAASHTVGVVVFAVLVALMPAPYERVDVFSGIAAGLSGGVGVVALYAALARGRMSLVAPITAALSGSLPAVYDLLTGSEVGGLSLAGLGLALVATVVVSATSVDEPDAESASMPPAALALSLLSGAAFAGSFISFSFATTMSGLWPVFIARLTSASVLTIIVVLRSRKLGVAREVQVATASAGILDSAANVTMLNAIRLGPLAVASVIGSLYPVVVVLLARFMLHERLRPVQRAAITVALLAVILSALR